MASDHLLSQRELAELGLAETPTGQHRYGWRPSIPNAFDPIYQSPSRLLSLPPKVDLRQAPYRPGGVTVPPHMDPLSAAWNQAQLGSCGPHSLGANLLFHQLQVDGTAQMPSILFIYWVARLLMGTVNSDSGVDNRTMLDAVERYGWCDAMLWPYIIDNFKVKPDEACFAQAKTRAGRFKRRSVQGDLSSIRACLADGKPFILGFSVYSSMETPAVAATGDVPMPRFGDSLLGGHDVLAIGYDDTTQQVDFLNSWNGWGRNGCGRLPYAYVSNPRLASDFWTVLDDGTIPDTTTTAAPTPPQPTPSDCGAFFDELAKLVERYRK